MSCINLDLDYAESKWIWKFHFEFWILLSGGEQVGFLPEPVAAGGERGAV